MRYGNSQDRKAAEQEKPTKLRPEESTREADEEVVLAQSVSQQDRQAAEREKPAKLRPERSMAEADEEIVA